MKDSVRVLLVDDDEDDYIITRDILEEIDELSFELEWVSSYEEALDVIARDVQDVYIVDYRLGASNGLELIRQAQHMGSDKPFILLTGQGDVETDAQAIKAGAADYLLKGQIDAQMLERSIRHSIDRATNLRKIKQLNEQLEERVRERTKQLDEAITKLQYTNDSLQRQVEERERAEEALRQSQEIYRAIANNFPNGLIVVYDRKFRLVFVDGRELYEAGLLKQELLYTDVLDMFAELVDEQGVLSPERRDRYQQLLQKPFDHEEALFEMDIDHKQFSANAVPLPVSKGDVQRALLVLKNITERKRVEDEIRKALKKERELSELKSRFVSMASHEFRTPLSTILSSVSLISRYKGVEQDEKRDKHIKRIKSSVNNLTQILNDFLSLSKLEEGKELLHVADISLDSFIREICEEMGGVKKTNQEIICAHSGELYPMRTDAQLLKNILINLISNAIKYSNSGKRIWVESWQDEYYTHISVRDEGMGIPEADQQHLFGRFFRAENALNIQGTGLGLHIVKKYLDIIKGSIAFESKEDVGTTFTITLPTNIVHKS